MATDMSDHRAASALGILVLALALAGCGSAPTASPVGAMPASPTVSAAPSVTPSAAAPPPTPVATPAPSTGLASTPIATAIPVADSSPTPTAGSTPSSCVALGAYAVVAGDTLSDIAQQYGVTVEDLLAANPQITDRRLIRPGDEITISPLISGRSAQERMARLTTSTTLVRSSAGAQATGVRTAVPSSGRTA